MTRDTAILFALVALLGVNQVVMRIPWLHERTVPFFGLLVVELLAGTAVMGWGLPGFEDTPAISWVVGLMFFLHVAQNLNVRQRAMADRAGGEGAAARREAIEAALARGEEE